MASIVLNSVDKIYAGGVKAVNGLNLEIRDGEFMVLVGPSGCGKSTALRMIAGLEDISGGEILIGEKVVNHLPPKDRDIAMVFQNYALYPHMTVEENLAFGLKLRKMPKAEISKRVGEAARMLGLEQYLKRKPPPCPAVSASVSRWAAPSCASRRPSSWTSRCPTWTPSSASPCAPRSTRCTSASA
nr:hypothetical protein GCM10020093_037810 [Planobispora longispora]